MRDIEVKKIKRDSSPIKNLPHLFDRPVVQASDFFSIFDLDEFLLMFCDPLYMNSARSQNMGSHFNGNGAMKSKLPSPTFFFNVSMIVMKSS